MKPVIISDAAIEDLDHIWDFLAGADPAIATRTCSELIEAAIDLAEFPERGQVVGQIRAHGIRRRVLRQWLILYRVTPRAVEVVRIVNGRSDLSQQLSSLS